MGVAGKGAWGARCVILCVCKGVCVCVCVCVNAERGQPALSGPENQIDLNFMRIRAGGGGGRDPDWVTPAAFIRTVPHTLIGRVRVIREKRMKNAKKNQEQTKILERWLKA